MMTLTGNRLPALVQVRLYPQKFPRLKLIPENTAIAQISQILLKAYSYKGYNSNTNQVTFIAENLYNEMMVDRHNLGMPYITMYEIEYALHKAVMDKDEFFFNVVSVYNVIKEFCLGEGHKALEDANKIAKQIEQQRTRQLQEVTDTMAIELYKNLKSK